MNYIREQLHKLWQFTHWKILNPARLPEFLMLHEYETDFGNFPTIRAAVRKAIQLNKTEFYITDYCVNLFLAKERDGTWSEFNDLGPGVARLDNYGNSMRQRPTFYDGEDSSGRSAPRYYGSRFYGDY